MFDRIIVKNISSLFGLQIASYVIPLITLPYLVRTLGVEWFGYLSFSLAIIQYVILITNYGFDLSATSSIAKSRDDRNKVSVIFWNVICIRVIACISGFLLILVISLFSDIINGILPILMASMSMAVGAAIFPQWLFQGKEQLGVISVCRIIAQFLSIPLLLIFVKNEGDAWLAALISGVPSIIVSMYSLLLIKKREWIVYRKPTLNELRFQMTDGWHLFVSTAAISLYTTSVTVVLGFVSGPISVGYFVAADRVLKSTLSLYSTVSNAFFPRVNATVAKSRETARQLIFKLGKLLFTFGLLCSLALYLFSDSAVCLLFGEGYTKTAEVLKVLSLLPAIISVSNIMGMQILVPFGYKKTFSKILLMSGGISVVILIPAIYLFGEMGAAMSVIATELMVSIFMTCAVYKMQLMKV